MCGIAPSRTIRDGGHGGQHRPGLSRRSYANLIVVLGAFFRSELLSGRSAAWLARLVRDQEVGGSNPLAPTTSFRANNLQQRKVPTTSWLCAKRSVVQMSSPNDLHFPLQIGVKWCDAATTFSSFCSPRSPNRTGFVMGRLKPRPTFETLRLTISSTSSGSLDLTQIRRI